MYLGIDLGTSNSAIVGHQEGRLTLFKAVSGEDVLPSVVMRDRTGSRYVGKRAYDQLQVSPQGIAARFKRLLGTDTALPFGTEDETITPEDASAEVLRQLLKQARMRVGDAAVEGTVITVPAAFNQMQSEATIRAAQAAGLDRVGLLQEPIAAALACLERPGTRSGLFLIYDLGGGTFDVALVRAVEGSVSIEAHEGINMLGGSDFDRMLIDRMVRPWLLANFTLPEDFHRRPEFRRLLALATANAELAKIELSFAEQAIVFVSDHDARTNDLDGRPIYLEIVVSRAELEALVAERIERSVELCRKVVADNGYAPSDIDRVVLIGGPSRMPIVRRLVPTGLGIAADLEIDPMTAVARGAAIYAEGRDWSGSEGGGSAGKQGRLQEAAGIGVSYDYEARTLRDRGRIRVTAQADGAEGLRVSALASDGRDYGERLVSESPVFSIQLGEGETRVRMTVTDAGGRPVADACRELTITRVVAVAAGAPCTSTIAVKVEDSDGVRTINVLEPLVTKGETLPRQGTKVLRAARKIDPGAAEWIDIELFEQAEGVPEPEANLLVGSFRLSGEDLPAYSRALAPGEQVVLHWSVDDSQLIRCSIELPDHGLHLRDHSFYIEDLGRVDFAARGRGYATEAMGAVNLRIDGARDVLARHAPDSLQDLYGRIHEQFDRLEITADADGFRSIAEEARLIGQDLSRLLHRPELRAAVLRHELDEADRSVRTLSAILSPGDMAEVAGHRATALQAIADARFQIARRAIEAIEKLRARALVAQPEFVVGQFRWLCGQRHAAVDQARFELTARRGEAALAANDAQALRQVVGELYGLLPSRVESGDVSALAGLRR
ncbi:Hsp70 family protein [Novosphingobium sp. BL-8H]|uniref:Hsp70 family protein n=1 Tax=Novosphingobium sp. BL-8H TaxID=3127640 RepID=UPI003757BF77